MSCKNKAVTTDSDGLIYSHNVEAFTETRGDTVYDGFSGRNCDNVSEATSVVEVNIEDEHGLTDTVKHVDVSRTHDHLEYEPIYDKETELAAYLRK